MTDKFDALTEADVNQIGQLIEMLERSSFDYLQVDTGNLRVTIGKGGVPAELEVNAVAPAARLAPSGTASVAPAVPPAVPQVSAAAAPSATKVWGDDVVAVTAPMIGRFYAQPEPGAAPFVALGTAVVQGATLGLIEVMKVYTSLEAPVPGIVCEICIEDGAFVEFGAVLFRIRKTGST